MKLFAKSKTHMLPMWKAWALIFLSVIVVFSFIFGIYYTYFLIQTIRANNEAYTVVAILQTGPEREVLSTSYLAELMDLSIDRKSNLVAFNERKATQLILKSPVIKQAKVKKIFPGTVYVDYTVREPVCTLYDYENIALDREGYLFPLRPFFSPKKLPEVYLGLLPFGVNEDEFGRVGGDWNCSLTTREAKLALEVVQELTSSKYQEQFRLLRVDTSFAYSELYGNRQVVLVIEDILHRQEEKSIVTYVFPRLLRLSTHNCFQDIEKYMMLRKKLMDRALLSLKKEKLQTHVKGPALIVDLRLPQLGFYK